MSLSVDIRIPLGVDVLPAMGLWGGYPGKMFSDEGSAGISEAEGAVPTGYWMWGGGSPQMLRGTCANVRGIMLVLEKT